MPRRRFALIALLALVLALAASACGGGDDEGTDTSGATDTGAGRRGELTKGGIYRIGRVVLRVHRGLRSDRRVPRHGTRPLLEPARCGTSWATSHEGGAAGNELVPDLATDSAEISGRRAHVYVHAEGRRRCSVRRSAARSPPKDVAYAFERIGTEALVAQYGFYYTVIKGMAEFTAGDAKTISGIETPDDKTIVSTLTQPTGDFLYRVAMPAAAPDSTGGGEVLHEGRRVRPQRRVLGPVHDRGLGQGRCDVAATRSSRHPVSIRRGIMSLVRNPDYDQSTDDDA